MNEIPTHPLENEPVRVFLGPSDVSLQCAECNKRKSSGGASFIFYRNPSTEEPMCGACLPPVQVADRTINYAVCEHCGRSAGGPDDGLFFDEVTKNLMCTACTVKLYGAPVDLYSFGTMAGQRFNQKGRKYPSLVRCVLALRSFILKDLALHANTGNRAVFKLDWRILNIQNEYLEPILINAADVHAAVTPAQIEKICADIRWHEQSACPAQPAV